MSRKTVMPARSMPTPCSPAAISQCCVVPDIDVFAIRQEPPSRRQRQKRDGGRTDIGQMFNTHRLVEIVCLRRLAASPQIPSAHAAFRINSHAVERLQAQRLDCDADSGPCDRREKFGTVLIADGLLLGLIHRRTQAGELMIEPKLATCN